MSFSLGSIVAHIKADIGDFKSKMNEVQTGIKKADKTFSDFGKGVQANGAKLTAFATTPIVALGVGFVKLASDAEETNSKFQAVFKDGADNAAQQLDNMAQTLGRSRTELRGYAATLQDTFVPLGFARDKASEMAISVVGLSEDLASFNNLNTADVVRDIQSALVGNTETLRKYGVVASQDAIIQEALTSGLIANKNQLDPTIKAQAIYNLMVKGTADAQGDAARTSESTANQMKALQSEFKGLGEELGTILIPLAIKLIDNLRKLTTWFSDLTEGQKKTILIIAGLVAVIGPLLIVLGTMIGLVTSLITLAGVLNIGLLPLIATFAGIVLAIIAVIAIGILLINNWDKVKAFGKSLVDSISANWTHLVGQLKQTGRNILDAIMWPFTEARKKIDEAVNWIKDKLDFTKRNSPSIVDIVERGVGKVNNALGGLQLAGVGVPRASLAGIGPGSAGGGIRSGATSINIDLTGAIISSDRDAMRVSKQIGNNIVKNLRSNIRV